MMYSEEDQAAWDALTPEQYSDAMMLDAAYESDAYLGLDALDNVRSCDWMQDDGSFKPDTYGKYDDAIRHATDEQIDRMYNDCMGGE